jgi:hypothetical protein
MTFNTSAYKRGASTNIVVGAAAIFTSDAPNAALPGVATGGENYSFRETLAQTGSDWTNIGYTANGLELMFEPDFGEVKVDQVLDVAKLYKQGMKVEMKTTFAEATLENLLVAIASNQTVATPAGWTTSDGIDLLAGQLGEYPVERSLIAVGASTQPTTGGVADATKATERIYKANRVLSIQNVTVSAKRDTATEFEVTFRLLPDDNGSYGNIIDRTYDLPA